MYYGVLIGSVKEFYIVTVQNGAHAHIKINADVEYNARIDIGSALNNVYFTIFKTTDYAVQTYLLPMIEAHLNSDWISPFNILAQDGQSGALDFYRTPSLYQHMAGCPGMTENLSGIYPSNVRIVDTTVRLSNAQLVTRYGELANAIRLMFTIYSNRKVFVFGILNRATNGNFMYNVNFAQTINQCTKESVPAYNDGAIFFYDQANRRLDGIFVMSGKQFKQYII